MAAEPLAVVPDKPVRVKITYPDGSWAKATVSRVEQDDSIEIIDEPAFDVYGVPIAAEYGEASKRAASSKEATK